MLIDRSHRSWAIGTAALLIFAGVLYLAYAAKWPSGPSGRSYPGILFGVVGTFLMAFAGALAIRKKTITTRAGSLSWWLKGHIWLGALSVPMILFHAAFRVGGSLEVILWILLAIVIASGFVGLALQNVIPSMMKLQLQSEMIPDQFDEACRRLIVAADERVTALCTPAVIQSALMNAGGQISPTSQPLDLLANFYIDTVRPFLAPGQSKNVRLISAEQAQGMFERLRSSLPESCLSTVDDLEESCSLRRRLGQQERLFRLLHGWLKIHIPASVALGVFTTIHVIASLYY
jgi:hypothetical protein